MNKLLILMLLLTGCASQDINKVPEGIKVALEKDMSACVFKGDVHGTSSLYGMFAEVAISNARKLAFSQAKAYGANAVVFQPFTTQYGGTSVHGNAYLCN